MKKFFYAIAILSVAVLAVNACKKGTPEEPTIKKRLVVYHSQTQPLIEWYKNEGLHHHINGHGTLERIFADIKKVIDNL